MTPALRESLGQCVRNVRLTWAQQQPDVAEHPSWTVPWSKLTERDREADRRIGEKLYSMGWFNARRDAVYALDNLEGP
jgi:hypothetical protein